MRHQGDSGSNMYIYNCGDCGTMLVVSETRIPSGMVETAFNHCCPVCSSNLRTCLRWKNDPFPIQFDRRCSSPILLHIEA